MISQNRICRVIIQIIAKSWPRDPFDEETKRTIYSDAESGDIQLTHTDRAKAYHAHAICKAINELSQNSQEVATWQQLLNCHP